MVRMTFYKGRPHEPVPYVGPHVLSTTVLPSTNPESHMYIRYE
jgi:hypothetical protein